MAGETAGPRLVHAWALTGCRVQFKSMTEEEARESGSHTAEYFWLTLRRDPWADRLTRDDLMHILQDQAITDFVFSAFDINGDGCVEEHELHTRLHKCFEYAPLSPPPPFRGRQDHVQRYPNSHESGTRHHG